MRLIPIVIAVLLLQFGSSYAAGGGDITFKPGGMDPVHFSHDYHLKKRGIKCMACHSSLFSGNGGGYQMKKEKLNKRDFCGHCHNGMKGFDLASEKNCIRCHRK